MSTRLRITFVLAGRGLFGGVRMVVAHGNGLIRRGHQVTIVCLRQPWPHRPRAFLKRLGREVRAVAGLDRDHLDEFQGQLLFVEGEKLARRVPDGDVVVATHWLTADSVAALPGAKGTKIYFIQGFETHAFAASQIEATWQLPMRKLVVSHWLRDQILTRVNDDQVVVVPNGISAEQFDAPPRTLRHPPTVGMAYSPAPVKGSAMAFEAIRLTRREIRDLKAICYGAGPPSREIPIPEDVAYYRRPTQSQLRDIYAGADVWLCASEKEGFALPPLEAMGCRCPVVVTRCGGPAEFVEDGVSGFFVEVGDVNAMARQMVTVLSSEEDWARMSDAAYETARRFDMERSDRLFEQALLDATNGYNNDERTVIAEAQGAASPRSPHVTPNQREAQRPE